MQSTRNKRIAILSILYNSDEMLPDFFKSLSLQEDVNFTLFLLNNNPSVVTRDLINELSKSNNFDNEVVYIESSENTGFAGGNNLLIKLALEKAFEFILLSNNDLLFEDANVLSAMIANYDYNDIITPKIHYFGKRETWYNGGYINYLTGLTPHTNIANTDNLIEPSERYVGFAPACFVMFHFSFFHDVGLFDEKFFVYYEDADLFLRSTNAGYKIKLLSKISIQHKVSKSTGGSSSPFSTYYFNRNRIYFVRKHFKGFNFIFSITYTVLAGLAKLVVYPFKRKKILLRSIIDGFKL